MTSPILAKQFLAIFAISVLAGTAAHAQSPDNITGNSSSPVPQQIQGQVQQQLQQQIQGQIQHEMLGVIQGQATAQVQAQLLSDVSRAAVLAERAIQISNTQAIAARVNAARANAVRQKLEAAGTRFGIPSATRRNAKNGTAQSAILANQSVQPSSSAKMKVALPQGFGAEDLKLYDKIFGIHNPIRGAAVKATEIKRPSGLQNPNPIRGAEVKATEIKPPTNAQNPNPIRGAEVKATEVKPPANANRPSPIPIRGDEVKADPAKPAPIRPIGSAEAKADLALKIQVAINNRRADISQMRDTAVTEGNLELMAQADQLEKVINTFVEAQARVRANAADASAMSTKGSAASQNVWMSNPQAAAPSEASESIDQQRQKQR